MRSIFYAFLLVMTGLFWQPSILYGQTSTQVIIANGGQFGPGNFATVASWNPTTNNYFIFDSIPAGSVQDVIIDGRVAYVAADSIIRSYNLDDYTMIASAFEPGVRKLAVWNTSLVVTRGFPTIDFYVQLRDKNTLGASVNDRISVSTYGEGIAIVGDTAYVALPGLFGDAIGHIGVLDLASGSLVSEVNLDTLGKGIFRIYYNPDDNSVYSINTLGFGASSGAFSRHDISTGTTTTTSVPFTVGGGGGIWNNQLYGIFGGNFTAVDLPAMTLAQNSIVAGSWAGSATDTSRSQFYLTRTDYFSFGSLHSYDNSGNLLDTLAIGISPEALAVDYNLPTSSTSPFNDEIYITAFPNPFMDELRIDISRLKQTPSSIELIDLQGRVLRVAPKGSDRLQVADLPQGHYFARVRTQRGDYIQPVIKQ